ncbi:MAG: hypothetical protein Q9182_006037 [Xanthomendoza sp. 2 TL-2023]
MAGASDKARFYIEQAVPELQELLRKKIFTKDEINSIAKKRSTFEHKLNARGSTASDYARYAEYEMNLDTLRWTRAKRLGIKSTSYNGQRRILFVLDRATRKFHGDTALWLQYLAFARKQKAHKRVAQIITNMLRLHPTNPELWIYAANYVWDERADVTEARGYMQRGLRFCSHSKHLWMEYMKLELIYLAKISARRRVLGLDSKALQKDQIRDDESPNGDMITLPPVTMEDMALGPPVNLSPPEESESNIKPTPALTGAIPIAIFNAAMKEFPHDPEFGAQMFDCVAGFHKFNSAERLLRHIVDFLMTATPTDAASLTRFIHQPVVGASAASTVLPRALMEVLNRFDSAMQTIISLSDPLEQDRVREAVGQYTIPWIVGYLTYPELDPDIRAVLTTLLKTAWNHCLHSLQCRAGKSSEGTIKLLEVLHQNGFNDLMQQGVASALRIWPEEPRLLALDRPVATLKLPQ